jgi:hypothetical protein
MSWASVHLQSTELYNTYLCMYCYDIRVTGHNFNEAHWKQNLRFLQQCFWRFRSSVVWHCVIRYTVSHILKEWRSPKYQELFIPRQCHIPQDLNLQTSKKPQHFTHDIQAAVVHFFTAVVLEITLFTASSALNGHCYTWKHKKDYAGPSYYYYYFVLLLLSLATSFFSMVILFNQWWSLPLRL